MFQQQLDAFEMIPPCGNVKRRLPPSVGVGGTRGVISQDPSCGQSIPFLAGNQETIPFRVLRLVEKGVYRIAALATAFIIVVDSTDSIGHIVFILCLRARAC